MSSKEVIFASDDFGISVEVIETAAAAHRPGVLTFERPAAEDFPCR
jgi:hypothetical protein